MAVWDLSKAFWDAALAFRNFLYNLSNFFWAGVSINNLGADYNARPRRRPVSSRPPAALRGVVVIYLRRSKGGPASLMDNPVVIVVLVCVLIFFVFFLIMSQEGDTAARVDSWLEGCLGCFTIVLFLAALLATSGRLLGKEIKYTGHNFDQWEKQMRTNAPSWSAYDLRMMFQGYFDRGFASTETEVARMTTLIGHSPRSYEDFAGETAKAWKS
jgi:hypothetical protein